MTRRRRYKIHMLFQNSTSMAMCSTTRNQKLFTTDPAKVTCKSCLKVMRWFAVRKPIFEENRSW